MGSLLVFSCNMGMLLAFVLGNYVSYLASPIILLAIPVIFIIAIAFFPETPQYLMKSGKEEVYNIEFIYSNSNSKNNIIFTRSY